MSTYSGKPFTVNHPAAEIAAKFEDLSTLKPKLDQLNDEQRSQVGKIEVDKDTITVNNSQFGSVKFQVAQCTPALVTMDAIGLPLPLKINLSMKPLTESSTEAVCSVDLDVPMALRAFIGPQITKITEQLTNVMQNALA